MAEVYKKDIPIVAPSFRVPRQPGTQVPFEGNQMAQIAMATFDPSGNSAKRPIGTYGLGVYIPIKAIVTRVWYDVVTTFVSAGADAGTIALQVQAADDAVAAIAISDATNVWDAGMHGSKIGFPNLGADAAHDSAVEVAALFTGTYLKLTAEREVSVVVGGQALTAGKMNVFVEYVISS